MNTDIKLKLAVLIDAENISASISEELFNEVKKRGNPNIKRIYGDWGKNKDWKIVINKYAMHAIHLASTKTTSHSNSKNGSDIALVVDAMDILLNSNSNIDGFCIVSSDADFTKLAIRIREAGKTIYGFGEDKAPDILKHACNDFIVIGKTKAQAMAPQKASSKNDDDSFEILKKLILQFRKEDGWMYLNVLAKNLKDKSIVLSYKGTTYNGKHLSKFLAKFPQLELNSSNQQVRLRA